MSVSLRMTRMGSKKRPFYRIVAIDSKNKRGGKYIELIGTYNPLTDEKKVSEEIALKWLKEGAIPSDTVRNILSEEGIIKKFHEFKSGLKKTKKNKKPRPNKKSNDKNKLNKKPILKVDINKKEDNKSISKPTSENKSIEEKTDKIAKEN